MTHTTTKVFTAIASILTLVGCTQPAAETDDERPDDELDLMDEQPVGSCDGGISELVYVIDTSSRLHRYDPSIVDPSAFALVGDVSCGPNMRPMSMSVGRDGFAYVEFAWLSGPDVDQCAGIHRVSLEDASCGERTSFTCGSAGFNQFGMGFVSDEAHGESDTLYIAEVSTGALGRIDFAAGSAIMVGMMEDGGAEFTGNALGELWGFFFYAEPPAIRMIDKHSGATLLNYDLSLPAPQGVHTWAFAHWGGSYHVFYYDDATTTSSHVYRLDPATGSFIELIAGTGLEIIGAGVSTCAPVEPPK